jgi:hypothetical protein
MSDAENKQTEAAVETADPHDYPGEQRYLGTCWTCMSQYRGLKGHVQLRRCYSCSQRSQPSPAASGATSAEFIKRAKHWLSDLNRLSDGEICCKLADLLASEDEALRRAEAAEAKFSAAITLNNAKGTILDSIAGRLLGLPNDFPDDQIEFAIRDRITAAEAVAKGLLAAVEAFKANYAKDYALELESSDRWIKWCEAEKDTHGMNFHQGKRSSHIFLNIEIQSLLRSLALLGEKPQPTVKP